MSSNATWRDSSSMIGAALAVLVVFEVFFLLSDLPSAVRYGIGGAIAVLLVLGVVQLGINRRQA